MERLGVRAKWRSVPPLDKNYYPAEQFRRAFLNGAAWRWRAAGTRCASGPVSTGFPARWTDIM